MGFRVARGCLRSVLKMVNSVIGMAGIALILYALWMIRAYISREHHYPSPDNTSPWFMYTFLGIGISFCIVTCSGHVAAETANGHCLSCYMIFVVLLIMLEAAVTTDVLLNSRWEEDFPPDPTGRFNEFEDFVRSNFEMCKWIGISIVAAQAISIILALVLRALGPDHGEYCDSDDDTIPARLPLLRNQIQQTHTADPHQLLKINDSWNLRNV